MSELQSNRLSSETIFTSFSKVCPSGMNLVDEHAATAIATTEMAMKPNHDKGFGNLYNMCLIIVNML